VRKHYHVALSDNLRNRSIEGIKILRRVFELDLRTAKDKMDGLRPVGQSMLLTVVEREGLLEGGFEIFGNTTRTVKIYLEESGVNGRKIEAIKRLRRATGWGLKETKDVMDAMWSQKKPIDIGIINEYTVTVLRGYGFKVTGWIEENFKDNEDLFTI